MRIAFALPLILLLFACTSGGKGQAPAGMRDVDEAKMQAVEEAAEHRGVRVYWMNPPVKQSAEK
jgi:hypothetical protein